MCEDGSIDVSEEDYLLPGTNSVGCEECKGRGDVWWCPACGADLDPEVLEFEEEVFYRHRQCRICGCTEHDCQDCIERTGDACSWAEEDLCSACVDLKCEDCGKAAEGIFRQPDDGKECGYDLIPLCYACSKDSYCPGCHDFWAGSGEFDRNNGWCDNCYSEIQERGYDEEMDFGDDYDPY